MFYSEPEDIGIVIASPHPPYITRNVPLVIIEGEIGQLSTGQHLQVSFVQILETSVSYLFNLFLKYCQTCPISPPKGDTSGLYRQVNLHVNSFLGKNKKSDLNKKA